MKKILVLILALVMMLSLTACGEKSMTVEITEENWSEYFELSSDSKELVILRIDKNDFDEVDHVEIKDSFVLKDGYKLGKEGFELTVGFDAIQKEYEYTLDLENNKVLLGDLLDARDYPQGGLSGTSTVTDEEPTFGYYSGIFVDQSSSCTPYLYTITRIEGTLSLVEE